MMETRQNFRQSNFELLRIVAMVMIVFHHFAIHGGFTFENTALSIPGFWYNFILMGGKIGVNLFVLISGYFLSQSTATGIRLAKVLRLWGQVFFYSVILHGVSVVYADNTSVQSFLACLTPISSRVWWFASTYFVLYLIHPYINLLLRTLDRKAYQRLLVLLLFCWCVIPTVLASDFESNYLLWFMTLYALAGYLRMYGLSRSISGHLGLLTAVFVALSYASGIVFTILGAKWPILTEKKFYFYEMNKLPTLAISVCLFMLFANANVKYSKWINRISSATFGVYLIHDYWVMRPLLWYTVFHNASCQDSILLIPYSIAVVFIVFASCTLFDLLRQATVERVYLRFVNRNTEKISSLLQRITGLLQRTLFGG